MSLILIIIHFHISPYISAINVHAYTKITMEEEESIDFNDA